jgi:hypothetical protein
MEAARIFHCLDKMRETQIQTHSAINQHGEQLRDMSAILRDLVHLQAEMTRNISLGRASTPPEKSPESSKPTGRDVVQWLAAATMMAWVLRGGDPQTLLKALALLSGG